MIVFLLIESVSLSLRHLIFKKNPNCAFGMLVVCLLCISEI